MQCALNDTKRTTYSESHKNTSQTDGQMLTDISGVYLKSSLKNHYFFLKAVFFKALHMI